MTKLVVALGLALLVEGPLAACNLDPEVGPLERACATNSEYDRPDGFDGTGADPRCSSSATAQNDCDRCENAKCCAERFGCYDDTVCRCADQAFDECLDHAAESDAAVGQATVDKCIADFEATGAAARARLECRKRECRTACVSRKC
jgi:hypothetical protein